MWSMSDLPVTLWVTTRNYPHYPVTDVNEKLEKAYNVTAPMSTHLRKQVATKAVLQCSSGEVALLSCQISHSIETHKRAYKEIGIAAQTRTG